MSTTYNDFARIVDEMNEEYGLRVAAVRERREQEAALDADPATARCGCGYRRNDTRCCTHSTTDVEQSWEMTPEAVGRNAKFAAFANSAQGRARERVCIKRALRAAGVEIPASILGDAAALRELADARGVTPYTWEQVKARNAHFAAVAAVQDIDPALYGLPQDSEIGPEFYPAPAEEPVLEGYGALSTTEYQEGEAVEVLFPDGWRSATFTGYRAAGPDEDFLRINVKLAEPGRSAEGCHPDCVRRPFPVVSVVNIGTDLEPRTRLAVDGTIVARGTAAGLEPLRLELEESPAKAIALRDHCREREARP